ncbi:uncharacterized protein LOC121053230 [Oryza brachyantha]|uniref:uncharacterized protein LOC121053230 n=1 Tax=Oryza brachyantha TaxID=4533 RepID=UPI001AD9A68E|nr:uncharacterized protein LOC121053230 [Oryza brachyantha]
MLGAQAAAAPPPAVAKLRAEPNLSTATIASLNDDLLLEVLLRLPSLPALIRSVLTCRSWLRAVRSSPEFRRRFRALHPDHMLGIFIDCDGPAVPGTPGFASADSLTGGRIRLSRLACRRLPRRLPPPAEPVRQEVRRPKPLDLGGTSTSSRCSVFAGMDRGFLLRSSRPRLGIGSSIHGLS